MAPIFAAAEDGFNVLCGDGQRRHCFPRFAQYIADYEEQRDLAGITSLRCTKCKIPPYLKRNPTPTVHHWRRRFPPRTMEDAMNLRGLHEDDPDRLRREFGYLPGVVPFSDAPREPQPGCTVFDALAPDTLHQVTKNFFDRLMQWVKQALEKEVGASRAKIQAEIDQRLKQLPPFPGLRHFSNGISHVDRWTGQEYKNLLRVYLGVIRGLGSADVISLVKVYLDVHRLSMYKSHTDNRDCRPDGRPEVAGTLQLLEAAVEDLWENLMDPQKVWIREGIVQPGWWTPKLHLMQHYSDEVQRKGTLPQCSTENTEAFHRPVKQAYNSSNRGSSSTAYITRTDSINVSLRRFLDEILGDMKTLLSQLPLGGGTLSDSVLTSSEHEGDQATELLVTLYERIMQIRHGRESEPGLVHLNIESRRLTGPCKTGYPKELRDAEKDLELPGLRRATLDMLALIHNNITTNRRRVEPELDGLHHVEINVYEQMKIVYKKQGTTDDFDEHTVRCTDQWAYQQNSKKVAPRKDTVLVLNQHDPNDEDWEDEGTMANRKVARIHCLFRLNVYPDRKFAYVQWFTCSNIPEVHSGMFVVSKSQRYEVIQLNCIERGIHLIPQFPRNIGATKRLPAGQTALDYYNTFVINNHIDLELFNSIF